CVLQLQRIVKRKGEPMRAAGSASSFMRALLIEAAEFHLQAELKWLSHRARRRRGVGQAAASKPLRPPVEGGGQDRTAPSLRLTARFLPEPLLSHLRSYLRLTCFQLHRVPWRRESVPCGSNPYL